MQNRNDHVGKAESWISWVLLFGNDLMRIEWRSDVFSTGDRHGRGVTVLSRDKKNVAWGGRRWWMQEWWVANVLKEWLCCCQYVSWCVSGTGRVSVCLDRHTITLQSPRTCCCGSHGRWRSLSVKKRLSTRRFSRRSSLHWRFSGEMEAFLCEFTGCDNSDLAGSH